MYCLAASSSGSRFSYNDYNYDNSNSNVSAHVVKIRNANHAHMAKNLASNGRQYPTMVETATKYSKANMKRFNNLYQQICELENLQLADSIARKGKLKSHGVKHHDKNREANLLSLQAMLVNGNYQTSGYTVFTIHEPKERLIYRLPYFPDRITHHAIMNILEPIFVSTFTADTYSCIKGKGIHAMVRSIKRALKDTAGTDYCLKLDIKKFYPSVYHEVLKQLLRRKIKDRQLLNLLDGIIDSAPGLPIGNYLSQYLANYYLTPFDHWLKEKMGVKYYWRYADDMVILAQSKAELHALLHQIRAYLVENLHLQVKRTYQVFPVDARGIDVVGYVFTHKKVRIRKSIKKSFARAVKKHPSIASIASYKGWAKHANSKHLLKKLLTVK